MRQKVERQNKARADADFIMENFDKHEVISHFPEIYFPKDKAEEIIEKAKYCDWANRKGHFVDYATILNNGNSEVAFIYEYFLTCDSVRFILIYNIDKEDPKLFKINIEKLSKKNPWIIHPENELLKYN